MNDNNKPKESLDQAPKSNPGADSAKPSAPRTDAVKASSNAVKASGWKRWLGKKWVFPATYMAAAAIILALMWVIQDSGKTEIKDDLMLGPNEQNEATQQEEDAVPVGAMLEEMQWPADRAEVDVNMPFFDASASKQEKQAAILENGNKFTPNMGVSLAREDNKTFDVRAALSGQVTRVENVPSIGHLVEITHDGGLVTIYYSLANVKVAKGDAVKQGDVIAQAGRNELEKELGVHLHFEVHKGVEPVNPETFIASSSEDKLTDQTSETDPSESSDQTAKQAKASE